jgi:hypothetical protein
MAKGSSKKTRTTTDNTDAKEHNALMAAAKEHEKPKYHDPDSGLQKPRTFALHP